MNALKFCLIPTSLSIFFRLTELTKETAQNTKRPGYYL